MPKATDQRATTIDPAGEFPFDLTSYLFHILTVLSRHRDAELDRALKAYGLTLSLHRALSVVFLLEPCTMRQLADYSAIDRTTMTRIVDQLVAKGLVERATPSADRRQVMLTLTDAGRDVHRKALKTIYKLNRQLLGDVPEETQRTVIRAKQRMLLNLVADRDLARRMLFLEPEEAS
jgi:DNA-binding MarR family transcriptional regulator